MGLEETLDPENWDNIRTLSHRMIDDMLNYLETIREKPVWQDIPEGVKSKFKVPIPKDGQDRKRIYQEFTENILLLSEKLNCPINKLKNIVPLTKFVSNCGSVVSTPNVKFSSSQKPILPTLQLTFHI